MRTFFLVLFWLSHFCWAMAQSPFPDASLEIKFQIPHPNYIPLIDWENYAITKREKKIDSAGYLRSQVPLTRSQIVYINYLDSTNKIHYYQVFLRTGDFIQCKEDNGKLIVLSSTKSSDITRFLQLSGLIGQDSLLRRPLMRKVSEEIYANLMRDLADQKWLEYQTTQDTTDATQNAYVQAALEGQQYARTQFYVTTKDWTEEMFNNIRINGRVYFRNAQENGFKPKVRIVPHEEALLSREYRLALTDYIGGESLIVGGDKRTEKLAEIYDTADRLLKDLPKTREDIIGSFLKNGGVMRDDELSAQLLRRFERDFPDSPALPQIRMNYWMVQKTKAGRQIPPLTLLLQDSTVVNFHSLHGQKTMLLLWNTWEDSCQVALSAVAKLSHKYKQSNVRIATLCVQNRFDSWKEVLQKQWPNAPKPLHFYADYAITNAVTYIFSPKRPMLVLLDAEGRFIEALSPFETDKITRWISSQANK